MLFAMHPGSARTEHAGPTLILASSDPLLRADLLQILNPLNLSLQTFPSGELAAKSMQNIHSPGILLLDARLSEVRNGQLLAAIAGSETRKRCAIALISDQISDEWIVRLREGVIDDIVPRNADASGWITHIHSMQRGHELYCELEQLRESALLETRRDPVTGAFNRDTMLSLLFRETDRVQRLSGALSAILLALDDFAGLSATLGASARDGLLREVAVRIGHMLRSYDLLGRSGTDSFLLVLPGCSTINAVLLAERMREEVFGEPFLIPGAECQETQIQQVSLTACFAVNSSRGRSPVVVLREAEHSLAQAKRSGPDTLRCSSESPLANEAAGPTLFSRTEMALW